MTIIIKDSGVLSWKVSGVFLGALRILFPLGGVLLLSKFRGFYSRDCIQRAERTLTAGSAVQCIYAYVESTLVLSVGRGGGRLGSPLQHCSTAALQPPLGHQPQQQQQHHTSRAQHTWLYLHSDSFKSTNIGLRKAFNFKIAKINCFHAEKNY